MSRRPLTPFGQATVKVQPGAFRSLAREAIAQLQAIEQLVNEVVAAAFAASRMPRSHEYQEGVRAVLLHRALARGLHLPYRQGTAQADAWFAGIEEGKDMWRSQVEAMVRAKRDSMPAPQAVMTASLAHTPAAAAR